MYSFLINKLLKSIYKRKQLIRKALALRKRSFQSYFKSCFRRIKLSTGSGSELVMDGGIAAQ
ncbi:hypothetical protein [Oceanobacillus caeni]|uniref:hypothetical protein n=1 Tax=Oceanobacillus caeni TaxID=405946 RepID=UPI0036D29653